MLMLVQVLHNTKKEAKKLLQKYVAFSLKINVLLHFFLLLRAQWQLAMYFESSSE